MRLGGQTATAVAAAAVLSLGLVGAGSDADHARLTGPTMIGLDFHDARVSDVAREVEKRTGRRVAAVPGYFTKGAFGSPMIKGRAESSWLDRTLTVESPAPVPFWEAIDRIAAAGRLAYEVTVFEQGGAASTGVSFREKGEGPGLASYSGPFRVGLGGVHEHRELILVRGAWVRFYPSGLAMPGTSADLEASPRDGGPLYVELRVAGEPGLVCRRDGPVKVLEAVDEEGRSLLAPAREDAARSFQAFAPVDGEVAPVVRLPLRRAEGSRRIKVLRGEIPVVAGMLKPEPAVVIRLGNTEGKTFRGGGAEFTVVTDRTEPDGRVSFALRGRLTGEMAPAVGRADRALLRSFQVQVVDVRGRPVSFNSSSSGGDNLGNLTWSYTYSPGDRPSAPPAEFRYTDLDRATRNVVFEFHDIPLP